jgi:hypothetical protein
MKPHLLLIVFAAMLLGCDSDTISITDQGVADPFLLGNYWIYDHTDYDTTGAVIAQYKDTVTVTERSGVQYLLNGKWFYNIGPEGIYGIFLHYKFPASVGDTMYASSDIMTKAADSVFRGSIRGMVQGVNIPLTSLTGTFLTYIYYEDISTADGMNVGRLVTYFSPTIGVIKEELYEVGPSFNPPLHLVSTKELSAYKIR